MGSFFKYLRLLPAAPALIFLFLLFALNPIEAPGGGAAGVKADPLMVGDALGPQTDQVMGVRHFCG